MRTPLVMMVAMGALATEAWALPHAPLGAGTRALTLELDRASGRVSIGDHTDTLAVPVLSATIAAGAVVLSPDLGPVMRGPSRWSIKLSRVNRLGTQVARELPIVGYGLPPVAVVAPVRLEAGERLRAELEVDFGRFDGATSAAVIIPPLELPLPESPSIATLSIDGKDARLPFDHARLTFDLDVPATVTLRVDDARGHRWMRRAISAARVTRPTRRAVSSPVRLDPSASALRVASAIVPLPTEGLRIAAAGVEHGRAWADLTLDEPGVAWRLSFGWSDGRKQSRYGIGRPPARVSVPVTSTPAWVEVEQSTARGAVVVSPRLRLARERPVVPTPEALVWVARAGALAGEVVRVGTSTGTRVLVAVSEDL